MPNNRLPVYDSRTTKAEAVALVKGVIPNSSTLCHRCRFLAARAILDERWIMTEATRQEAEHAYFELVDESSKDRHAH